MNYIIYTRVSPKGSDFSGDTSCKLQEEKCREYVRLKGGEVAGVVTDELFSGGSMDRPGFQKILLDVKMDAAPWETLIVFRMDRLTRSQLDQLIIFKTFAEHNKGIVSATEPGFDWSTPTGRCQLGVIASVNQYQREVNAENSRHKMIQIASQGYGRSGSRLSVINAARSMITGFMLMNRMLPLHK